MALFGRLPRRRVAGERRCQTIGIAGRSGGERIDDPLGDPQAPARLHPAQEIRKLNARKVSDSPQRVKARKSRSPEVMQAIVDAPGARRRIAPDCDDATHDVAARNRFDDVRLCVPGRPVVFGRDRDDPVRDMQTITPKDDDVADPRGRG